MRASRSTTARAASASLLFVHAALGCTVNAPPSSGPSTGLETAAPTTPSPPVVIPVPVVTASGPSTTPSATVPAPDPSPAPDPTAAPAPGPGSRACTGITGCGQRELCQGPEGCGVGWSCGPMRACTRDLALFCGCNGLTFRGSSTCPPQPFKHRGACADAKPAR